MVQHGFLLECLHFILFKHEDIDPREWSTEILQSSSLQDVLKHRGVCYKNSIFQLVTINYKFN
jgi:hypothetical protein